MTTNFIGVLLSNSPNYTVTTGFNTQLYDAAGSQSITVQAGASLSLVGSLGANSIRVSGAASSWQAYRDGSTAILINTDGSRIELPATTDIQTLQFDDLSRELRINVSGAAAAVLLGSQTLGSTATAIGDSPPPPAPDPEPEPGSGTKAPWTLLMGQSQYYPSTLNGIFISDGTAEGTGLKTLEGVSSTL